MEEILKRGLKKQQLIQINACRVCLQVYHLSDISNPKGNSIRDQYLTGLKLTYPRSTSWWPQQRYLFHKAWCLWAKTLSKKININTTILAANFRVKEWIFPVTE